MTETATVVSEVDAQETETAGGYKNPLLQGMHRVSAYQTTDGATHTTRKAAHIAQSTINFTAMVKEAFPEAQAEGDLVGWLVENQDEVRSFLGLVREG
jgi:hypothetical protein